MWLKPIEFRLEVPMKKSQMVIIIIIKYMVFLGQKFNLERNYSMLTMKLYLDRPIFSLLIKGATAFKCCLKLWGSIKIGLKCKSIINTVIIKNKIHVLSK